MKRHGTWLQAAVRAHQAQTFDHLQRAQQARDELSAAEQLASRSSQALHTLSQSWAGRRRDASLSLELDGVYRLFHGFLRDKAEVAGESQRACQARMEVAMTDLQKTHAVQRTLEKVAQQAAAQRRREAWDKETQGAAEAWLLGQFVRPWGAPKPECSIAVPASPVAGEIDPDGGSPKTRPQGGGSDDIDTRQ